MGRARARERERARNNYLVAAVVSIAVISLVVWTVLTKVESERHQLNKLTMCPAAGPKGHYILLIDTTDSFSFTQKESVMSLMRDIVERKVPEGYLLSIFALGEDYEINSRPIVELCNPGTASTKSEWTDDVKGLRKKYQQQFLAPLTKQATSLMSARPGKASPIFEMLQLVGINGFDRHAIEGERRLIIISDMLQNTSGYQMYSQTPDFQKFSATPYGKKAQASLPGVDIELHYLMNTPQVQGRANAHFWEYYFDQAKARLKAVNVIAG